MTTELLLPDEQDVADLETFVSRARRADPGGAIRLVAGGGVLAASVCLVPGTGLLGEGTILGLRVGALAAPAEVDVLVPFEAVTDRIARMRRESSTALAVPPMTTSAPWAALSPPRGGWEARGVVAVENLRAGAVAGIDEVAAGAPEGSGAAAVADLRRRVWARPLPLAGGAAVEGGPAAGLAFGAHALGFLRTEPASWHVAGRWQRLSTPAGHVLAR